jgi:hypothetical protein
MKGLIENLDPMKNKLSKVIFKHICYRLLVNMVRYFFIRIIIISSLDYFKIPNYKR